MATKHVGPCNVRQNCMEMYGFHGEALSWALLFLPFDAPPNAHVTRFLLANIDSLMFITASLIRLISTLLGSQS